MLRDDRRGVNLAWYVQNAWSNAKLAQKNFFKKLMFHPMTVYNELNTTSPYLRKRVNHWRLSIFSNIYTNDNKHIIDCQSMSRTWCFFFFWLPIKCFIKPKQDLITTCKRCVYISQQRTLVYVCNRLRMKMSKQLSMYRRGVMNSVNCNLWADIDHK